MARPAILTLDADGQHDPAEIPRFLARARGRPAARPRDRPPQLPDDAAARRLSNNLGGLAFSWAVGRYPRQPVGLPARVAALAEATLASEEHGFAFEVEQITTCIRMGGTIAWVPIRTIYAGAPSHIRPLAHLREFLRIVREARREVRTPLTPPP